MRGLVVRLQSGFYSVKTDDGLRVCRLRGRLKKVRQQGDVVAVGDWVVITPLDGCSGVIEEVEPRQRAFSRMAPTRRGRYQQILIANLDQVVLVFACAQPQPRFGMLDRFLIIAEKQGIPALIVVNKVDLLEVGQPERLFSQYIQLGYEVSFTSAYTSEGLEDLRKKLVNKISLFTGPSGAGKTSLLNAIQPGLGRSVRHVSRLTSKGRHATVVREMFPLAGGGYVADTPGLRALALWDIAPEEVDGYFPEMRALVAKCQFSDCTHVHEPGCAVLAALNQGKIHPERYKSYLHIRFGEEEEQKYN